MSTSDVQGPETGGVGSTLRMLLAKDLRRAWRNPVPWLVHLLVPLVITGLIGLTFGGRSDAGALGRIRFAVVDEDDSPLTQFLRGAANRREASQYLEPVFLDRETALRRLTGNKISAVVIIPTNFTRNYLSGAVPTSIELIKNPAQSVHPAVLEELLGVAVTALNAVARNFQSELTAWLAVFEGKGDHHQVAALIERAGDRFQAVRQYIHPPLVSYEKEARPDEPKGGGAGAAPRFNMFGFLLVGMVGMFLLFLAGNGMTDLLRELRLHTFERYHTLRERLMPFVAGKIVFTIVLLVLGAVIMLGGGGLVFGIQWRQPLALGVLTFTYACFAAGLIAVLGALVPDERRAGAINTVVGMALGLAGGCAFPPESFPTFLRAHITPLLPSFWYADAARGLEFAGASAPWTIVTIKLIGLSVLLIVLAAFLFRRRFSSGLCL